MTVSYNLDVSSVSSFNSLRLLFRWRGSIWKSVLGELAIFAVAYAVVAHAYHNYMVPNNFGASHFEAFAHQCGQLMNTIPLTFMLAFFVSIIVERWRTTFNNMGWSENVALLTNTTIVNDSADAAIMRRSIVRYIVLAQILTFRDVSMRVRRRFPNLDSITKAGFLTLSEAEHLTEIELVYNKYWVPINWAMNIAQRALRKGYINAPPTLNILLTEIKSFRTNLATVCNFDWVPVPIAYPQVVFLAVRVYFLLCLITRQYFPPKGDSVEIASMIALPMMTMFEYIFLVGWMKVAESLLNPLGEDDDDFELNFLIDKNIFTGMAIVAEHDVVPLLSKDRFSDPNFQPYYSVESQKSRVMGALIGSVSNVTLAEGSLDVPMVPVSPRRSIGDIPSSERPRIMTPRLRTTASSLRVPFTGIIPIDRPSSCRGRGRSKSENLTEEQLGNVGGGTSNPVFVKDDESEDQRLHKPIRFTSSLSKVEETDYDDYPLETSPAAPRITRRHAFEKHDEETARL
ncbi:unnamed protein product [Caenorhabditis auriculariae]|uniref:Bestrophin homolog n=1 Tax=Caenorhabditis auriculariae TaxID=2777116 RepID=A0A8S1HL84_9PELO|nr:unnamed protein product [Caenorhabditis auriculariae]